MIEPAPIDVHADLPEVVSVTFKPEALTSLEEWRMVLVRLAPRSRRPALRIAILIVYFCGSCAVVGFGLGTMGSPGLDPGTMALAGFGIGLMIPLRYWLVKRALIKALRGVGPITVELARDSVTILSRDRATRVDWPGVLGLRANSTEVVIRYRAGDLSWIPTRVFADPDHESRFLQLAGFGLRVVVGGVGHAGRGRARELPGAQLGGHLARAGHDRAPQAAPPLQLVLVHLVQVHLGPSQNRQSAKTGSQNILHALVMTVRPRERRRSSLPSFTWSRYTCTPAKKGSQPK